MSITAEMTHFFFFLRRQDYARAAYWLGKIEYQLKESDRDFFHDQIMGSTYKKPDYDKLMILVDKIVTQYAKF